VASPANRPNRATGRVVATDIDTRFLRALNYPALEVREHNVVTDALEAETFDLVHGRTLLMHLPEREQVLNKMAQAIRPGGWIVVEDLDVYTQTPVPGMKPWQSDLFVQGTEADYAFLEDRDVTVHMGLQLPPIVELHWVSIRCLARGVPGLFVAGRGLDDRPRRPTESQNIIKPPTHSLHNLPVSS
jgi:SAM-dependent methyltransferase